MAGPWTGNTSHSYSILFDGEPVEACLVQPGVLRCRCPAHAAGVASLQVACDGYVVSDSVAFEYRRQLQNESSPEKALLDRLADVETRLQGPGPPSPAAHLEERLVAYCQVKLLHSTQNRRKINFGKRKIYCDKGREHSWFDWKLDILTLIWRTHSMINLKNSWFFVSKKIIFCPKFIDFFQIKSWFFVAENLYFLFQKMTFWPKNFLFPNEKLIFCPKTDFFIEKSVFCPKKFIFLQIKSWFFIPGKLYFLSQKLFFVPNKKLIFCPKLIDFFQEKIDLFFFSGSDFSTSASILFNHLILDSEFF